MNFSWLKCKRETTLTVEEFLKVWKEARDANLIELGLLPQSHLDRPDLMAHRKELARNGHNSLGRSVGRENFKDDSDLLARDD